MYGRIISTLQYSDYVTHQIIRQNLTAFLLSLLGAASYWVTLILIIKYVGAEESHP